MSRIQHDTIPFDENDRIWRLVQKYRLSPILKPPPKPIPGKMSMKAATLWDDEVRETRELPPWAKQEDPDASKLKPWGKFIPYWTDLWVWHDGSAVILNACDRDRMVLHRVVIKWVSTEQKMRKLKAEIDRRGRDGSLTDLAALVEEIVPVDPDKPPRPSKPKSAFKSFKEARKKLEEAGTGIRNEGFDAWVRRYVEPSERPSEWTQATALYENYVKHVRRWGDNQPDKRLSQLEMATETRFGIMLREIGLMKKRRRSGYFYPLRLKTGA